MTAPLHSATHGAYLTAWPDPTNLAVEFTLLRSDKRAGDVTGEVRVFDTHAPERLLHHARLNLTSTRSRAELARHLTARTNGQAPDWTGMLETACVAAIEAYRAGEPAILLRDAVEPEDAGWLLPPLVLGRHPTIIFGDGGTGKSYLALAAALSVHADRADLLGIQPTTTRRVAFLDYEFDAWEHRERMRRLVGESMPDIVYPCAAPLRDQVDRLRTVIRSTGINFLVVDSVGAACGGEPESAEVALGFFTGLRQLGLGALCIAHTTKNGSEDRPFGSAFWHNMARSTWLAKRQQELGAASFTVGLFHKKSNSGPLARPLGYELSFEAERTVIRPTDVHDVPELASGLGLAERIAHAVRVEPLTYAELAEELDRDAEVIRKTVARNGRRFTRITRLPDRVTAVALRAEEAG